MATTLAHRPEARSYTVEKLVLSVQRGLLRVPRFQRGLRWDAGDVRKLLDSIRRGFPIGTLLLWKRTTPASAERLEIGPLTIDAPQSSEAVWVVDGQQRVSALAGVLLHPPVDFSHAPDNFEFYFDLDKDEFVRRPVRALPRDNWLPLTEVLDSARLIKWLLPRSAVIGKDAEGRAITLGKAFREYEVPAVVVESDSDEILREIFERTNNAGRKLRQDEIFNALHAARAGEQPSALSEMADHLRGLAFGDPGDLPLRQAVLAVRDIDPTRQVADISRDTKVWRGAMADALQALRRVIVFLKTNANIPNVLLLPYKFPVVPLVKFFHRFPEPHARSRDLLVRWLWRGAAAGTLRGEVSQLRRAFKAIGDDEEESVQALLRQVPSFARPVEPYGDFDLRTARTRLAALALVAARPRHFETGQPIDVSASLESRRRESFVRLFVRTNVVPSALVRQTGNRFLHPGPEGSSLLTAVSRAAKERPDILDTHCMTQAACEALLAGHYDEAIDLREAEVLKREEALVARYARWGETDRPSLMALTEDG